MADCPLQLLPDQPARFVNHGWHDCGSGLLRRSGGIASTGVRPSPPRREGLGQARRAVRKDEASGADERIFGGGCFAEFALGRRFAPTRGLAVADERSCARLVVLGRTVRGLKLTGFGWRSRSSSRSRRSRGSRAHQCRPSRRMVRRSRPRLPKICARSPIFSTSRRYGLG